MALPNPFAAKAETAASYLTVALSDTKLQALYWHVLHGKPELIQASSVKAYTATDNVAVVTDQALQELGKESEHINDVVFALEPSWVTPTDVESAHKPMLKHISEELSLRPVGYVVFSEALAKKFLADQPHSSLVLVYITNQSLIVESLYRGAAVATEKVGRSGNPVADVTEALARMTRAHAELSLPTQMMVASHELTHGELEEQQQLLLANEWTTQGFPHAPTIEVVDRNALLSAVVAQAGTAIAGGDMSADHPAPTTASSFGVPVAVQPPPEEPVETAVESPTHIHKTHPVHHEPVATLPDDDEVEAPRKRSLLPPKLARWLDHHKKFVLLGFGSGIVALFLVASIGLAVGTKAVVTLDVAKKPLSKEVTIIVDPSRTSSDPSSLILAAETIEREVEGGKTIQTTGVKLVGEKAKGTVTLFNKTDSVKTFEAGTKLSSGKLTFTLDETVQIASASVKKDTGSESKEYGKADASVTASAIGSDSNLASKTELTVETFSTNTYSAVVATALAGGSSREVRVVSDADRQNVLKELKQELIEKANKELEEQAPEGKSVVPTQTVVVDSSEYSDEVGEEVGTLSLAATMTVTALSYTVSDLQPLAQQVLQADIPSGYKLSADQPQLLTSPDSSASRSAKVSLKANVSSVAVPDLNLQQLAADVAGKSVAEAQQQLSDRDTIESAVVQLYPALAQRLIPRLPKDPAKIQVEVSE